jgi:hypothetical protein
MDDNRNDVAAHASEFFDRAVASGLDFRMGVTGVGMSLNGRLCSEISTDPEHGGGADRFLEPGERDIFEACIINPPGYEYSDEYSLHNAREAVKQHLPRKADDATKIRPEATIVIIHATDEAPKGWKDSVPGANTYRWYCSPPIEALQATAAYVQPDIELFSGADPAWGEAARASVHLIGGVCGNSCDPMAEVAHGLNEIVHATSGVVADVCQTDLGDSLQIMIDTIAGLASPAELETVPISASLAVAVGTEQLARSRVQGFDYAPGSNALVFVNVPFSKGVQVAASYRRYERQMTVE